MDLVVQYDNTVRNSLQDIIQFRYGDDSIDAAKQEWIELPYYQMKTDSEFYLVFNTIDKMESILQKRNWNRLYKDFQMIYKNKWIWESAKTVNCNIKRILEYRFEYLKDSNEELYPIDWYFQSVIQFQIKLWNYVPEANITWDSIFGIYLRYKLGIRDIIFVILKEYRYLLKYHIVFLIKYRYHKILLEY